MINIVSRIQDYYYITIIITITNYISFMQLLLLLLLSIITILYQLSITTLFEVRILINSVNCKAANENP